LISGRILPDSRLCCVQGGRDLGRYDSLGGAQKLAAN